MSGKPPYRVPTMEEIRAIPWNGYNAVSTFSGCGGSSLGYRMAGFRVLWASEFVPAAQDTYRANSSPYTVLDTRDIRKVNGRDILDAVGLGVGEIDLFDGSPPCASFSTSGRREDGWGTVKPYSDTRQRTDDLFFEYARLVEETQPRTFVAENVAGLVRGTAKGYFKLILARLKECGYRVEARVLDASWLGVPQARQRLIFVGVRNDLDLASAFPPALPYRYVVRDALPGLTGRVIYDSSGTFTTGDFTEKPFPTVTVGPHSANSYHFQLHGAGGQTLLPPAFPEPLPYRYTVRDALPWIEAQGDNAGFGGGKMRSSDHPSPTIGASPNTGNGRFPPSRVIAAPDSRPITQDPETGENITINTVRGRTVHHVRRLTLAELRRISGFPDDFTLTGSYSKRWERIGRAVPPVMMSHIAATIRDRILTPLREQV